MARILKPPAPLDLADNEPSVFLAGSIEMGRAEPWQAAVEQALSDLPVTILNPRRDAWDASWEQSIHNAQFREQVEGELEGQDRATVIAMYFAPATQAPITLLELGLFSSSGKLVVCCPPGFWRRGNVEVVCARYGVPLVAELEELITRRPRANSGQCAFRLEWTADDMRINPHRLGQTVGVSSAAPRSKCEAQRATD